MPELCGPDDLARTFPDLIGDSPLRATWLYTPIGGMIGVADDRALHMLEFPIRDRLQTHLRKLGRIGLGPTPITDVLQGELAAYFARRLTRFTTPIAMQGTDFTIKVWKTLQTIPHGTVQTYTQIAARTGHPAAVRAVGRANGANPISILIPCHRVLGANGQLTGYGGGLWRKEWLIAHETPSTPNSGPATAFTA